MKVRFIGKVKFKSGFVTYELGNEYEVDAAFASKFPKLFEKIAEKPKAESKPAIKPKPKAKIKPTLKED